ncbi:MAG: HD domain-containing protein [Oscillospiraceae bacterium]|nr:HD domain-containing protein [Oscillospiraceae bacterium]
MNTLDRARIDKAATFLREKLESGEFMRAHPADQRYRLEHSFRVANIMRRIALREDFDETEAVIAGLLHDVAYCEEFGEDGWREHGRRSAAIARPFLRELGLPEDRIGEICFGIAIHVDDEADFPGERTPFALSVGDADNIDRFDVRRIHEALCREGFLELDLESRRALAENRLSRLEKLREMPMGTPTAEALWRDRIDFAVAFYERLRAQLDSSDRII